MAHRRESGRLTRRSFLHAAGLVVGSLGVPDLLTPAQAKASVPVPHVSRRSDAFRLGVLLPRSGIYPQLGANLVSGMNLFFDQMQCSLNGRPIELLTRETGINGVRTPQAVEALLQDQVDLVAGVVNPNISGTLRSRLAAAQTPLLAVHVGENIVRPGKHDQWIAHNSLGYWQSAWAMGAWAAHNLGSRAIMASSFYDSGYDSLYAFRHGFESAGGTISAALVTHLPQDRNALPQAIATIKQSAPDFVYGAYCGQPALDFVRAYAGDGSAGKIPLAASAFMVDEHMLTAHGTAALGITSCLPWAADLNTAEYWVFASSFRARSGQAPDVFALLGYETAQIIAEAVQTTGSTRQRDQFAAALRSVQFQSPRGTWRIDAASQTPTMPLYLRKVQHRAGTLSNVVLTELGSTPRHQAALATLRRSPKTGWTNPYLGV